MWFWGQKESRPLITSAAPQAWSRLCPSRLQSSFFSEGQLDKANSLSRIPWLKLYWSPLLHVKIDIYEGVWSLTPQGFLSFFGGEGVSWTVCQIFIRDIAKHFSFLLLSSQDKQFSGSTMLDLQKKKKKVLWYYYHGNTIDSRHGIIWSVMYMNMGLIQYHSIFQSTIILPSDTLLVMLQYFVLRDWKTSHNIWFTLIESY